MVRHLQEAAHSGRGKEREGSKMQCRNGSGNGREEEESENTQPLSSSCAHDSQKWKKKRSKLD